DGGEERRGEERIDSESLLARFLTLRATRFRSLSNLPLANCRTQGFSSTLHHFLAQGRWPWARKWRSGVYSQITSSTIVSLAFPFLLQPVGVKKMDSTTNTYGYHVENIKRTLKAPFWTRKFAASLCPCESSKPAKRCCYTKDNEWYKEP